MDALTALVTVTSSLCDAIESATRAVGLDPVARRDGSASADDIVGHGDGVDLVVASDDEHRDLESFVAELRSRRPDLSIVAVATERLQRDCGDENVETRLLDAGASAVVRADDSSDEWTGVLRHRLRSLARDGTTGSSRDRTRIHEVTAALDELDREFDICGTAIDRIGEIVDYDACIVAEADDDFFVPLAATANDPRPGRGRLRVDEGVAGETYRTGQSVLVDDVATHDTARHDLPYDSVLSVPVGDFGVFQLASAGRSAYDERDRELVELLASSLAHALTRIRYEQQLTRERDRATALFQNIPDAAVEYVLVDGEPRIERVNSAFVDVFGYEPSTAVGESTLDLLVPPGTAEEATSTHEALRAGEFTERQVSRVTVDGVAPFLLRDVPIASDDDTPRGYLIYTDISELVERERELERQNERLDAFASMVSHDLRNPLSAAQGYTDLTLETEDLSHLSVVQEEHGRMFDMIDDLLTLARQGDFIGEREPVALERVVADAWATVETGSATVETGPLPTVEGDPDRLQQLFENLFRNSVEHGSTSSRAESDDAVEHGSTSPHSQAREDTVEHGSTSSRAESDDAVGNGGDVTVTVDRFDGGFFVADDGVGIPESEREAVLDIGMTTAADTGGTGLGLAIVSEVADGHGWTVTVTESVDGGARFEFHTERDEEVDTT